MFNKFITQLKDKKKGIEKIIFQLNYVEIVGEQPIQNVYIAYTGFPSLEEFFNRSGLEVDIESLWKMNASQLEDVAQKQDKYIKNLKKNYKKVYDDLVPIFNKHSQCQQIIKDLQNQIDQLQQAQHLNKSQNNQQQSPDLKNTDVFDLLQQQQHGKVEQQQAILISLQDEAVENSITIPKKELQILKEELDRIRNQCTSICVELRRLQEENDDLSMALDAEKSHKEKVISKKDKELDEVYKKIKELEVQYQIILINNEKYNQEKQQLQSQIEENNISKQDISQQYEQQFEFMKKYKLRSEEEQILRIQDLQSRITMELLKSQNLIRDLDRITSISNAQKEEISQMFAKITSLEQQLQTQQSKRQRDKNIISEFQSRSNKNKLTILEYEEQIRNYEIKIQDQTKVDQDNLNEFQNKLEEKNLIIQNLEKEVSDSLITKKELEETIQMLNKSNENLNLSISDKDKYIHKLNQTIELLQQKREYAIKEINNLTEKVQQNVQFQKQVAQPSPQIEKTGSVKFVEILKKKRINIFEYLKDKSGRLHKLIQIVYKEFLKILIEFENDCKLSSNLHQFLIGFEKKINDCVTSSQELEDVFEDLGL